MSDRGAVFFILPNHHLRFLLLASLLAVWMTASCQVMAEGPFTELPRDHWSYKSVENLHILGLIDVNAGNFYRLGYSVSKYEMAVWVASALYTLADEAGLTVNRQPPHPYDVAQVAKQYGSSNPNKALTADQVANLLKLSEFLSEELRELGYVFTSNSNGRLVLVNANAMQTAVEMPAFGGGAKTGTRSGAAPAGSTSGISTSNLQELDIWNTGERFGKADAAASPGWGLTLELGDLLVMAGQKPISGSAQNSGANAIGLKYRIDRLNVQLGFASEVASSNTNTLTSGWRIASAGVEYAIAPASKAEAGLSLSENPAARTTTADFGLRYQQNDASVLLGYRLVDLTGSELPGQNDTHNNLATAEFSIRF